MIYAKELKKLGDDGTTLVYWGDFEVDSYADFADFATTFPDTLFIMSSKAHSISDNKKYMLDSSGNWVEQDESPFSDVYTKTEIDAMLASMQYEIDSFYAVKSAVEDIINYSIVKNLFETTATTQTIADVTFTNNGDGTWTTSGTAAARRQKALPFPVSNSFPAGDYVLSGCPAGGAEGATVKYCLYIWDMTESSRVSMNDTGEGVEFSWIPNPAHTYQIGIDIRSGTNANGLTFKPMITLKSYHNLTPAFRPHP